MTIEQWMRDKNIANYGPHLEPIIKLAFEAGQSDGYESGFDDGQTSILSGCTISTTDPAVMEAAVLSSGLWECPNGGPWFRIGSPFGVTLEAAYASLAELA